MKTGWEWLLFIWMFLAGQSAKANDCPDLIHETPEQQFLYVSIDDILYRFSYVAGVVFKDGKNYTYIDYKMEKLATERPTNDDHVIEDDFEGVSISFASRQFHMRPKGRLEIEFPLPTDCEIRDEVAFISERRFLGFTILGRLVSPSVLNAFYVPVLR